MFKSQANFTTKVPHSDSDCFAIYGNFGIYSSFSDLMHDDCLEIIQVDINQAIKLSPKDIIADDET
jgi:hypothetical protein